MVVSILLSHLERDGGSPDRSNACRLTINVEGLQTEGLRALFSRALSPSPIDRPATVTEFLDELARELGAAEQARL